MHRCAFADEEPRVAVWGRSRLRLLIVRHAIAVPRGTPGIADDDRPLTERGIDRFRGAAAGLARLVARPDVILTSPLPRAKETALLAAKAWGGPEPRATRCLADGTVEDLFKVLGRHRSAAGVAIFGHEPHLSEVLAALLGARGSEGLEFKKGGAALVEIEGPPQEGGKLIWFLPPRILRLR